MASVFPELTHGVFPRRPAWLGGKTTAALADPMRHLLVLRFALFNMVTFGFLGVAHVNGYLNMIVEADKTGLSIAIFTVFIAGLAMCTYKIAEVNRDLNAASDRNPAANSLAARHVEKLRGKAAEGRSVLAGAMRLTLSHRIAVIRHIANSLVLLGLIGTVIGFIIALSGVDPQKASEFESISPMVSTLIQGMSTALYTTLVGAVLNLWLMVNYQMLATGTVRLITTLQERGAAHE
jgi:biopolymer transport protein ExbB/TolQ